MRLTGCRFGKSWSINSVCHSATIRVDRDCHVVDGERAVFHDSIVVGLPCQSIAFGRQDFGDHVREKLENARNEIEKQTENIPNFEAQLATPDLTNNFSTIEIKKLRRELHDARSDLRTARWNEFKFGWLEAHLVPWLPMDKFNLLAYLLGTLLMLTLLKEVCGYFQT